MISSGEPPIQQQWRIQITPARYTIDNTFQTYNYTCLQKINANSINLLNFSILCAFPNVTLDYRLITVKVLGVDYRVTITDQYLNNFWSIFDLSTIVQGALNAQTPYVWTVTQGGNNNSFGIITCNTPFNLVANLGLQNNQIARYLGFGDLLGLAYTNGPSLSFQSPFPYNVQVTENINVQFRGIGELNSDSVAVLAQVPIAPINTLIEWQSPFYQFSRQIIDKYAPYPIQRIQISFLDDQSRPMIIQDNRVSLTLLCERFEKT